jgi:hypothetical protein
VLARPGVVFVIALILYSACATLWALASPIYSVPDESAHAVKAVAQVRGELVGHREPGVRQLVVDLPADYSYSPQSLCFATHSETPADCGIEVGSPTGTRWAPTWVSTYNPLYYYLVGWPSLFFGGPAGIYAMRIVSALLGGVFFAWAAQTAMASRRARWLPAGLAFAALPMAMYLSGAVNPNGAEIAAAVALTPALLRLLEAHDLERFDEPLLSRRYLWLIVTISAVTLANVRALGPLWLVIIVALCLLAGGRPAVSRLFRTRASYPWLAIIAAGGLFSLGWTLVGGSLSGQAEKADAPLVGAGFAQSAVYMVRATPTFLTQALGYFGWFDAPLPGFAFWPAIAAVAIVLVLAFTSAVRRDVLTLGTVAALAALVPVVTQAYSAHQTGIIWQGRYGLFLYLGGIIIAVWLLSRRGGERIGFLSVRVTWVVGALIWSFASLAFVLVLRRYVIGNATPIGGMFKNPQWEPPLGWLTLVLLFVLALGAFMAFLGLLARSAAAPAGVERL